MKGSGTATGANGELTPRQETFLAAMLTQPTIKAACEATKIPEGTARRWLTQPHIRKAYREVRRQAVEQSLSALQVVMGEAVEALQRNLTSGQATVEVAAAKAIIEYSVRAVEVVDLAERVEGIEAMLVQQQQEGKRVA